MTPTEPGFYWAKFFIRISDAREAGEFAPSERWETVEIQEMLHRDEDDSERFSVHVIGDTESYPIKYFHWGPRIPTQEEIAAKDAEIERLNKLLDHVLSREASQ